MEKATIKLSRKIQLNIDLPTTEERKEVWEKLYRWQNRCMRAGNLIISHLYVLAMMKDFFYLSESVKYKLADEKKDPSGILQFSHSTCTYRLVSKRFKGEIPTNVLSCLNYELIERFNRNFTEYVTGNRSLDNFKPNTGFLFGVQSLRRLQYNEEKKTFCFRLFKIPFRAYLGRDFTDKRALLQQVIDGKVKLCSSRVKLDKGKIFWIPVFEIPKEVHSLNPATVAEASLSLEHPISVKIGKNSLQIGNKEEFLHRRLAIQAAHSRTKAAVTYSRGGNGKKRKLKALDRFKDMESNYIANRLHEYSRRLIDFCVKHQSGTLVLLDMQENTEIAREEQFILRNWSYYELMTKIKYKAENAGIEVITT